MKELDKYSIKGVVLCAYCSGQVISNSGKIMLNYPEKKLYCWTCHRNYDMDYCYNLRKENEIVKIPLEELR